jgi:hypothetical protein
MSSILRSHISSYSRQERNLRKALEELDRKFKAYLLEAYENIDGLACITFRSPWSDDGSPGKKFYPDVKIEAGLLVEYGNSGHATKTVRIKEEYDMIEYLKGKGWQNLNFQIMKSSLDVFGKRVDKYVSEDDVRRRTIELEKALG